MSAAELIDPNSSLWAWLAYDLRFYRHKHGLSGSQLGQIVGCVRSTVSNLEAGRHRLDDRQAKLLDKHWDTGGHFQRLLMFARLGHDPDWFRQHVQYEARAAVIKIYEAMLIPGLLQTEAYARVLFTDAGSKKVEAQVSARMARQKILTRTDPPLVWVLLDEGVIDRPVGGTELMGAQLARLLEVAEMPNVSLRVVPRSTGYHMGLEGAFEVLTVDGTDVAYTEAAGGGRLVLDTAEVRSFATRYDKIGARALPEDASYCLIKQVMEAMI